MQKRRFIQCDVFTHKPTRGNALAVVVDGQGLSDTEMQTFAAWTNLAETTFLLPPSDPQADYKVRIFTTVREMLFAGHPTLGSCAAWLYTGGKPKDRKLIKQECGVGIVEIDMTCDLPAFVAPSTSIESMDKNHLDDITRALKINPKSIVQTAQLNNGPVWQAIELDCADDVLAVNSAAVRWPVFKSIGLIGKQLPQSECDYEVRMLAPSSGMSEDPITGSLNSALAVWLQAQGRLKDQLIIGQGTNINREGRVFIKADQANPERILIGGQTHILVDGSVVI
jgi:PhzF family phenazine biosynthesis protein